MATRSVSSTLAIDSSRKSLEDIIVMNLIPLGKSLLSSSSFWEMRSLVSLALAPANWKLRNVTPGCPFASPQKA